MKRMKIPCFMVFLLLIVWFLVDFLVLLPQAWKKMTSS
jgi:hypothetical protein